MRNVGPQDVRNIIRARGMWTGRTMEYARVVLSLPPLRAASGCLPAVYVTRRGCGALWTAFIEQALGISLRQAVDRGAIKSRVYGRHGRAGVKSSRRRGLYANCLKLYV